MLNLQNAMKYRVLHRGARRYEKLVVLAYIELAKNTLECIIIEMPKVGDALAPPFPAHLLYN